MGDVRLGELLVADGVVTLDAVERALGQHQETGTRLGTRLIELGLVDADTIARALAKLHGVPSVRRKHFERVDVEMARRVSARLAREHGVVPIAVTTGATHELILAMRDPGDLEAIREIGFITGARIKPAAAPEGLIDEFLVQLYGPDPVASTPPAETTPPVANPYEPESAGYDELELAVELPGRQPAQSGSPGAPPPPMTAAPVLAPAAASPLPSARSLSMGGAGIVGFLLKFAPLVVAVLVGGWVMNLSVCSSGNRHREIDVGGQAYFAEHVSLEVALPLDWSYVPSENYSRDSSGINERGALFYHGGSFSEPDQALVLLTADTQGRLPSPMSNKLFRQMLSGLYGNTSSQGISMDVSGCEITNARTEQTGVCRGSATYMDNDWNLELYVWIESGGWIVGAVFLMKDPIDVVQDDIDEMLWTVQLRI